MMGATVSMTGLSCFIRSVMAPSHGLSAPATTGVSAAFTAFHASAIAPTCLDRAI